MSIHMLLSLFLTVSRLFHAEGTFCITRAMPSPRYFFFFFFFPLVPSVAWSSLALLLHVLVVYLGLPAALATRLSLPLCFP